MGDIQDVENILGYEFKNDGLLEKALQSAGVPYQGNNKNEGNKRLAQVGDALIRLITLDDCFHEGKNIGQCEKICQRELSNCALQNVQQNCRLTPHIQTCPAQQGIVSRVTGATAVEALLGAVWYDSQKNYKDVHKVLHQLCIDNELLESKTHTFD
ncbi:ribonuclease iii [Fusarium agapanthi]|uniref:Ribonuclease iii n=1 Tax=Fusarium agapanthi TaxID=1803897 RepID=A0A9P5BIS0_9HYPO|nr:ribonuclease iii [Fusarium agapanthi]